MIDPKTVDAVMVTRRGPVDAGVMATLDGFRRVIVWDNSEQADLKVLGRWQAAAAAETEFVYFQDDDCVVD